MIYIVLLTAKISSEYLARSEVRFAYIFYILFAASVSIIFIMRDLQWGRYFVEIVTVSMAIVVMCGKYTYADVNVYSCSYEKSNEISEYIVKQYVDAYENGEKSVEIKVPVCGNGDVNEFPFADYGAVRISSDLWWHGMTEYKIDAVFVPEKKVNEKFGM